MKSAAARLAACFALGAVVGTLLDGIHAYRDVLSYPHPAFGRWAWFVPVEFGLVIASVALAAPFLERLGGARAAWWSVPTRVAELLAFAFLYYLTSVVDGGWSIALALALAALAVGRLALARAPGDWPYVALAAALGPAGEALLSALEAFEYSDPDLVGVPIWLPALWANAGFMVRRIVVPIAIPSGRGKEPRVVRDHARDTELAEGLDAGGVVHRPDV